MIAELIVPFLLSITAPEAGKMVEQPKVDEVAVNTSQDDLLAKCGSGRMNDEKAKPGEMKTDGMKPEEVKTNAVKPEEMKPAGTKPEEMKAKGMKPEEMKAAGTKPEEMKAKGTKPEEMKAAETKPEEMKKNARTNNKTPKANPEPKNGEKKNSGDVGNCSRCGGSHTSKK